MTIDISRLTSQEPIKFNFLESILFKSNLNLENNNINLKVSGIIHKIGDIYTCKATGETSLNFFCDFCTAPSEIKVNFPITEEFKKLENHQDTIDDINYIKSDEINISDFVLASLHLQLPMQVLCKEGCKGLCVICGTNQNTGHCNCEIDNSQHDSRFEVLKTLFGGK